MTNRITAEELLAVLLKAYQRYCLMDEEGEPQTHDLACYCTDTGAGEIIDGKLTGDLLVCVPCQMKEAIDKATTLSLKRCSKCGVLSTVNIHKYCGNGSEKESHRWVKVEG